MRYSWIDNLKVIALFMVVMGHIPIDGDGMIGKLIYNFHMPLFFFLSGLVHKDKSVMSNVRRLLVPYILFNILFLAVEAGWMFRQEGNWNFVATSILGIFFPLKHPIDYPTWFLLCLFEIKVIVKLVCSIRARIVVAILSIILASFVSDKYSLPFFWLEVIMALPYYIVGILLKEHLLKVQYSKGRTILCAALSCGGGYLIAVSYSEYIWTDVYCRPHQFLISLLGVCFAVSLTLSLFTRRISTVENISNGAIAVIALHPLFIQYLRRLLLLTGHEWIVTNLFQCLLYSSIVFVLCCITIPFFNKRLPWLIGK